jgi:glucose/arabinose dehydrogenase
MPVQMPGKNVQLRCRPLLPSRTAAKLPAIRIENGENQVPNPHPVLKGLCGCAAAVLLLMAAGARAAGPAPLYHSAGDCAGFPRLPMSSVAGTCVGLVAEHLGFARGVTALGDEVYVADMGGWHKNRGRILRLARNGRGKPEVVLSGLNLPNAIVPGPGGSLYVGLSGKIIRFDPKAADPAHSVQDVVVNLPESGRHPLAALLVAADGSLWVNVGSGTDHCEQESGAAPDPAQPCAETQGAPPRGSILHLTPGAQPVDAQTLKPYASGLRNSMALALLPDGRLLAASNARDYINRADPSLSDEQLPHEPLSLLQAGADYGWPYCYDEQRPSPEYPKADCSTRHKPDLLLPAHAAPLGMLLYRGKALPGLDGRLLIGFHGYRANGHRLVSVALGADGRPSGQPQEIVYDWDYAAGVHPQGAPVGLWQLDDGSVLITEDHNGTLLRLAPGG